MEHLENNPLRLSRAGLLMAIWGVLILAAGITTQYYYPSVEGVMLIWSVVTVVGLGAQALCQLKDQPLNYAIWVGAMVVGWLFTHYASSPGVGLFRDIAPIWIIMLGLAYIPTAFQIDSRFRYLAALHLVVGGLMELSVRGVLDIVFLRSNGSLLLGIVGGGTMLVGAALCRIRVEEHQDKPLRVTRLLHE